MAGFWFGLHAMGGSAGLRADWQWYMGDALAVAQPDWKWLSAGSLLKAEAGGCFRLVQSLDPCLAPWLAALQKRPPPNLVQSIHRQIASLRSELGAVAGSRESLSDDVARQVFGIIKQLESAGRGGCRKAALVQVFRLYCLESLSAQAVARRCGCAKSLVIKRLRELECKLGRKPAALRPIAAQFESMEQSLTDSRARRIYRPAAAYGEEEEEE